MTVADYDVVVVGAGPAGSACAISLAERGRRVLLLDKATFPRDKVCGDFLSPRSLAVLAELGCWDALRRAQPHSIRRSLVHLNGELVSTGPLPKVGRLPGFGMVVPRAVSDEILFRRAAAAGAEVVEGFVATDLELHESGITVRGRHTKRPRAVSAQLVVVADGARSRMAASLGVTPVSGQKDLFALRAYLHDVPSAPDATAVFFDADFFPGYAWVFPTGDGGANVGMGMHMDVCRRYGINLRDRFVRWLQDDPGLRSMVGDADRNVRIAGWPLTGYDGTHSNHADRVLIVGDAARFVDPINGEGVHTALESARLAAAVADRAIASGDLSAASLSAYERDSASEVRTGPADVGPPRDDPEEPCSVATVAADHQDGGGAVDAAIPNSPRRAAASWRASSPPTRGCRRGSPSGLRSNAGLLASSPGGGSQCHDGVDGAVRGRAVRPEGVHHRLDARDRNQVG